MRKIFLLLTAVLTAGLLAAETIYGECGPDMEWEFNTGSGALYLIGTGPMDDYASFRETPWAQYKDQIKSIQTDSRSQYTTIGANAFFGCKNLMSVDLPNTITDIKQRAFCGCSSLTSITIPNSVTSIGYEVFYDCTGLTSPVYNAHVFAFMPPSYSGEYTIPDGIEIISSTAFYSCSNLTSVTIPNSVTSIGNYAFYHCSGLTSPVYNAHLFAFMPFSYSGEYTIPDGIEIIAGGAFYSCSNLTSVTIPNSVTSIGNYAFQYCYGLTTITCKAVNPPALGDDVFYYVDTTIPLYVPDQSVSSYLAAEQWKVFDIQADPFEAIDQVTHRSSSTGQKLLRDGVLLIERNGKTYNAHGAEVR